MTTRTYSQYIVLTGLNADIDTGTEEIVPVARGTLPTNEFAASIVSSDNTNDKTAGTGALTATIRGIEKTTYFAKEETVTLNGTGAVTTTQKFIRINGVEVATAGSAGVNAGTLTTSLNSQSMDVVPIGHNLSHSAVYAVPAATEAVIEQISVSAVVATNNVTGIRFEYRSIATITAPGPWKVYNFGSLKSAVENGRTVIDVDGAIIVPPKHEFRVQLTVAVDNAVTSATVWFGLRPR
jgi:hypothetical protein